MTSEVDEHHASLLEAFVRVLTAEREIAQAEKAMSDSENALKLAVAGHRTELADAWLAIQALMEETGEIEVTLPDDGPYDYRIQWSTPSETVQVADIDALPDAFVKTERKPKRSEIAKHLKALRKVGHELPNWASLERGRPSLGWRAVKKGAS